MTNTFIESIILGAIQGIAEWLPVSSEGMLLLAKTTLFNSPASVEAMIHEALFLHAGSATAAIIYFWKDIRRLFSAIRQSPKKTSSDWNIINFFIISTLISGVLGWILLKNLSILLKTLQSSSKAILLVIGMCLLITGSLQLIKKQIGQHRMENLTKKDGILLGIIQAFAVLPGLSRSGLTVSTLLLRKYDADSAIRISFLMGIPIVVLGNIVLNASGKNFQIADLTGLASSFLFSILTIHILIKTAQKINFGMFVLLAGFLVILAAFMPAM